MKHVLIILMLLCFRSSVMFGQTFNARDFIFLSTMSQGGIKSFMDKKGFAIAYDYPDGDSVISYRKKDRSGRKPGNPKMIVDFFENLKSRYFILKDITRDEYMDDIRYLAHSGFTFDKDKELPIDSMILFQKDNLSVVSRFRKKDSALQYSFELTQKRLPDSIKFAEDLLQFDSHEFLQSYFGKKNVSGDLYYFSENQLRKCSVLFGGTDYQAVFVWGDQVNLNRLSYIIISNVIPTKGGEHSGVPDGNNAWPFQNGVHVGMTLADLLKLNGKDFQIYGNNSDYSFMVKPENDGKIDFKKTAIMLNCNNCYDNDILNQVTVSARELIKANLELKIFDIIIYP